MSPRVVECRHPAPAIPGRCRALSAMQPPLVTLHSLHSPSPPSSRLARSIGKNNADKINDGPHRPLCLDDAQVDAPQVAPPPHTTGTTYSFPRTPTLDPGRT